MFAFRRSQSSTAPTRFLILHLPTKTTRNLCSFHATNHIWPRQSESAKSNNFSGLSQFQSVAIHHNKYLRSLSHVTFTPRQESCNHLPLNWSRRFFSQIDLSNSLEDNYSDASSTKQDQIEEPSAFSDKKQYRLSKLISAYAPNISISRNEAERLIRGGFVTIAGAPITTPHFLISLEEAHDSGTKVGNTRLQLQIPKDSFKKIDADSMLTKPDRLDSNTIDDIKDTRVWLVHKLPGELVTENDPYERPSMLQRLRRGGVSISPSSKSSLASTHLKPIGRLDMQTEGLILLTNNGRYAHEMEHPRNQFHRTYRVRIFGNLTESKLSAIRKGKVLIDGTRYDKMKVTIDKVQGNKKRRKQNGGRGPANTWLHITCTEGKNRMIRRVFEYLGMKVTRLIRISYGDYTLQTIPAGMAIEVPVKQLESQKSKGSLWTKRYSKQSVQKKKDLMLETRQRSGPQASPIQWVRNI